MIDAQVLREEIRNLKRLIRDDPAVRARYDVDGDGEISGEEWEKAVQLLRQELERNAVQPAAASLAAFEAVRGTHAPSAGTSPLLSCPEILVKQQVELREAVFGYETSNSYVFRDLTTGAELGGADEASGGFGGFLARQFLGPGRPLNLAITESSGGVWTEGKRPFSLIAFIKPPTMTVTWGQGPLGTIRRIWPLLIRRRYEIRVANKAGPGLLIDGTLFHPWTFPVMKRGRQVACILKKWSGLGREMFTDADNFLVRFEDPGLSVAERRLLLAAALAIDFDFFESKPRH
jgi:hypothetical protein